MKVDFIIGAVFLYIALMMGLWLNSAWMLIGVFVLDLDIIWNEFWRIFIKREKTFSFSSLLDEYSYTHKFWLHNPLLVLPAIFIISLWYGGVVFALLFTGSVFAHLIHDTVDSNFDGVRWLWPFTRKSFKFRNGSWYAQSPERLREAAEIKAKTGRSTSEILNDNL